MKIIDPHVHASLMKGPEVLKMSMAGVEAGVNPMLHALPWITSGPTLLAMWDDFLGRWVSYFAARSVQLYNTLSVPMAGISSEGIEECLKKLPEYLKHERVVGIGEIGLNNGTEAEVRLFRTQLQIAREHNVPIIVHTPPPGEPQRKAVTKQIIDIIREEKFPIKRAVLDHTAKDTIEDNLGSGATVGLSVCYDKNRPDDAAEMVKDNPSKRDRIFVNSEFGYGYDGYFSVPRAVVGMRLLGLAREEIEKVTWHNPKVFFNLPVK
jgi:predicted metal-dependent TIM-barrel fold hydrolase